MQNNIAIPSSTSSFIKLVQLAIAVAGIWFVLHSWVKTSYQGQAILQNQAEQLMRENLLTLSQAAAYLIEHDQLDGLEQLTRNIAASPFLYDVVFYDSNGVRISWSEASAAARVMYGKFASQPLVPLVQEIRNEQQLLGYIKISLQPDTKLNPSFARWQQLMHHLLLLLLLTGLIGYLLRRSFSRFSRQGFRLTKP
ncbi:AhpA/YtjB family protein [Arsukibacterium sp.]|uniref:AhpA/YtjB family protein n=1 Tax=Arsukibacterium sp. TaxID=1977258 RepID=UPI00299CE819|nr:AhpA/YtjB family protein [Arsukibacterium sp.]MDX1536673.1 AhpA/YtjB family protein [Arsukibacterium sp.]